MDKDDIERRIREEEDYIRCPKMGNSLERFISKNPEGVEDSVIARLLMITEEKVQKIYEEAIVKLRASMVNSEDDN